MNITAEQIENWAKKQETNTGEFPEQIHLAIREALDMPKFKELTAVAIGHATDVQFRSGNLVALSALAMTMFESGINIVLDIQQQEELEKCLSLEQKS